MAETIYTFYIRLKLIKVNSFLQDMKYKPLYPIIYDINDAFNGFAYV